MGLNETVGLRSVVGMVSITSDLGDEDEYKYPATRERYFETDR